MALSTMISLELPHLTVLSKCDLVDDKKVLKRYVKLEYGKTFVDAGDDEHIKAFHAVGGDVDKIDFKSLDEKKAFEKDQNYSVKDKFNEKYKVLTDKIKDIVHDYNLVSLLPLDVTEPESIQEIIYHADNIMQFGELKEPEENAYLEAENRLNEGQDSFFQGNMNFEG